MSFQNVRDVEEALRAGRLSVRELYEIWEQRQPVLDPTASKSYGGGQTGTGQIPWLQTDLRLARRFTEDAVENEEFLLACDAAREIVRHWTSQRDDDRTELVRVRMDYAKALTRLGSTDMARAELEPCVSPEFRPVLGRGLTASLLMLLGDIQREDAYRAEDKATRLQATEAALGFYERALQADGSLDALAATAAMSLALGASDASLRVRAHDRAREILDLAMKFEHKDGPRFGTARARTEALVVLGKIDEAASAYGALSTMDGATIPALAEARHRSAFLAEALGESRDRFRTAFPPLQLIVFAGHLPDRPGDVPRFPLDLVGDVRGMLGRTLNAIGGGIGLVSASAGADLLLIEALHARKDRFHVILPWTRDEFRRTSIRPFEPPGQPPIWEPAFDEAIRDAATIREIGQLYQPGSDAGWEYMAEVTAGLALHVARVSRLDVQPIALWNGQPGRGAGGTAWFVDFWRDNLRRDVIVLNMPQPSAATSSAPQRAQGRRRAERSILHQEVKSMLFADIVGYSRLTEHVIPEFVTCFLERVSQLAATSKHAPCSLNTWGDAVYGVFDFARDAGSFALELTRMIHDNRAEWLARGLYWEERVSETAEPVKHPLNIRVGLHAGPVFLHYDPVVRRLGFTGAHVNRAARIEPVAKAGEVFASEEFAALAELNAEIQRRDGDGGAGAGFVCEYAGTMPLAKGYPGRYRIYRLLPARRLDIEALAKAAHELYCEDARGRDETPATNSALRIWEDLSEDLRDSNRALAADIPNKLRMLGYELAPTKGLPPSDIALPPERVEEVAIHEHGRWMRERQRQDWTYAPTRDDARKQHPLLVEWKDLPDLNREKDRQTVRTLPRLVEMAGFRVRRIAPDR